MIDFSRKWLIHFSWYPLPVCLRYCGVTVCPLTESRSKIKVSVIHKHSNKGLSYHIRGFFIIKFTRILKKCYCKHESMIFLMLKRWNFLISDFYFPGGQRRPPPTSPVQGVVVVVVVIPRMALIWLMTRSLIIPIKRSPGLRTPRTPQTPWSRGGSPPGPCRPSPRPSCQLLNENVLWIWTDKIVQKYW